MKKESNFLKNMHFGVKNQFSGILKFLGIFCSDLVGTIGFLEALGMDYLLSCLEMISKGPSMQLFFLN